MSNMFLVQMRSLFGNAFKFPLIKANAGLLKKALLRLLSLILILSLAWLWVLLAAKPALAQDNFINYNATMQNYNSRLNLVGKVFITAKNVETSNCNVSTLV